jgi:hypothetical protein
LLLAICTVSSRTEKNKTTNESMAAETIPATARAPSGEKRKNCKPNCLSRILNIGTEENAASVAKAGTTQSEDRRKLRRRVRKAHDIVIRR